MFKQLSMILLLVCCVCNKVISMEIPQTNAAHSEMVIPKQFNIEDIKYSIASVQEAFLGQYGNKPIVEGTTLIGNITTRGSTVFVNLRGSIGLEFIQTLQTQLVPLSVGSIPLAGSAHSGFLTAAQNLKPSIHSLLSQHCIEIWTIHVKY